MGILILFRACLLVYPLNGPERRINIDSLYNTNTVNTVNTVKMKKRGKRVFFVWVQKEFVIFITKSGITVSRCGHDILTKK